MIEKLIAVDKIEVLSNGCVQVRTETKVVENGSVIAQSFHRHVVVPGADYSSEEARVQTICAATHTTEVIEACKAAIDAVIPKD